VLLVLCCCDCEIPVEGVEAVAAVVVPPVVVGAVVVVVVVGAVVVDVAGLAVALVVAALAAGDGVAVAVAVVLAVLELAVLGEAARMTPLELDMMSVVATDPFAPPELRKVDELGSWMLATAFATPAPERNPAEPGVGMIIPIPAARRSIRPSSLSEATLARSCSLRVCSAEPLSIERPTLAPSFSTSTCMVTIPASISPSTGIHARPRTSRSISLWSGRLRRKALARCRAASSGACLVCGCRRGPGCFWGVGRGGALGRGRSGVWTRPRGGAPPAAARSRTTGPDTRRGAVGA
jgi:hypothetical protein